MLFYISEIYLRTRICTINMFEVAQNAKLLLMNNYNNNVFLW
jgi:hypothetical protein